MASRAAGAQRTADEAVRCVQGKTTPPDYLTEAELIGLMEEHGIGTDASISVHVNNVCERGYVRVEAGRRVVPTDLGVTLISGYQRIDPELCRPQVRPPPRRPLRSLGDRLCPMHSAEATKPGAQY